MGDEARLFSAGLIVGVSSPVTRAPADGLNGDNPVVRNTERPYFPNKFIS